MGGTFKWIAMKVGSALGRNVSSLFYQLIYREIYREVHHLTQDGAQTVDLCNKLGFLAAEESAERQKAIFRFFPSKPEKVLEYVPVLWEMYFGQPMQDYTTEWDRSDPERPILNYNIKCDPMLFDLGQDPKHDNLPWKSFWNGENAYGSMMAGLLTQCSSYMLDFRGKDQRTVLKNTKHVLHGDSYFQFQCQVIPKDEMPSFRLDDLPEVKLPESHNQISENAALERFLSIFSDYINFETLDELLDDPTASTRTFLSNIIEKGTKMSAMDLFDHFTNDEEKFLQAIGFLIVLSTNEYGQIPEKLFKIDAFSRIYGQQFLFVRNHLDLMFPLPIVQDMHKWIMGVFEGIAPPAFITNLSLIPANKLIDLIFQGAQKAYTDIGLDFASLSASMYDEIKYLSRSEVEEQQASVSSSTSPSPAEGSQKDQKDQKDQKEQKNIKSQLNAQMVEQIMVISNAIFSMPGNLAVIGLYQTISKGSKFFHNSFQQIQLAAQKVVDLNDQIKDLSD